MTEINKEPTEIENPDLFFLEVAAEKMEDVKAMAILGKHYMAIEPDEEKAVKYLKMAADEGHAESTFLLGIMYQSESSKVPYDMKKSLELIHDAAAMGWPLAMAILGRSYCNGRDGLEKDTETGKKWLKKSIGLDCKEGMYFLGMQYWFHEDNKDLARKYWKRAANENHIDSMRILGDSYRDEAKLLPKNKAAEPNQYAEYYYKRGAEMGDADCQAKLAWMYELTYNKWSEASKYFNMAVKNGEEPSALFGLALHYYLGLGTEDIDKKKAFTLCSKAVKSGHEPAKSLLGKMYYSGEGAEANQEKGLALLSQRAKFGETLARTFLTDIAEKNNDQKAREILSSLA